jgi:hypothetical protein
MTRTARPTEFAFSTAGINFSHHALANQIVVGGSFNNADEFVSDCSFESSVAAGDLEIRIADSGQQDAHEGFSTPFWQIYVFDSGAAFIDS